ncbi:DUF2254 domain-containing protein [Azospirillum rugosum]|uniref:Membrane protein n=1 Tax=Azospirillum rugosum TaxID=416170 RepID=A0ABS4SR45_9PROT|nr:DUF2254 domain-containing protein [Azospirillum rugosum]MBP2295052.1 putative membrane protein [Azospirillum rugosum]MDQ0528875.1 putative membrane protein [Azospirillum rugosum]
MPDRLRHYWTFLRGSLWFVPLLMSLAAVALAVLLLTHRGLLPDGAVELWLVYSGDPESARQLMGALLSGIITMTSLVVSITVVVLTLAAGQLGPRLVRNFISDPQTQAVLGLFVATILYLLVVFRSIGGPSTNGIPHLAVSVGTGLSALCLFVLLFFVHKLARAIMYDNVVRDVTRELRATIDRLLPGADSPLSAPVPPPEDAVWIGLGHDGYVEAIDFDTLVREARSAEVVLWIMVRPGHYVLTRGDHVAVHPPEACSDALLKAIRGAFIIGAERTPTQDLEYGIRQLVEIALRALSPGINDVFTAIAVIDNLSSALSQIFERPLEAAARCDDDGKLRVVRNVTDYDGLVRAAFDQIRQAGNAMPAVLIRLTEGVARLAPYTRTDEQRRPLLDQLALIEAAGEHGIVQDRDRATLRQRGREARARLTGLV